MTSAADTVEFPTLYADDGLSASSMCMQLSGVWLAAQTHRRVGWVERLLSYAQRFVGRVRRAWQSEPSPVVSLFEEGSPSASSTLLPQLSYAAMIDVMLPPESFPRAEIHERSGDVDEGRLAGVPVEIAYDDTTPLVLE